MRILAIAFAVTILAGTHQTAAVLAQAYGPGPYYDPAPREPNPEYFRPYGDQDRQDYISPEERRERERQRQNMWRYRQELYPRNRYRPY